MWKPHLGLEKEHTNPTLLKEVFYSEYLIEQSAFPSVLFSQDRAENFVLPQAGPAQ